MPKISYSCAVNAALDTVWKLLIEKVEQPQNFLPGVIHSRILQHYGNGVLREVKRDGMLVKEKVVIDRTHGEIHYFLLEHPSFSGRVVNRVVASAAQNPATPQLLTVELDWTPKDEEAERRLAQELPEQLQREVLLLKERAESLEQEDSQPIATPYAFGMTVALPFADALRRVHEELQKEGFGIISQIDITQKFREKLHKEFRNYLILGACNPGLSYQAFGIDLNIGTLLPCNVAVYAISDSRTVVMAMDPVAALSLVGNPQLTELAHAVQQSMKRAISAL